RYQGSTSRYQGSTSPDQGSTSHYQGSTSRDQGSLSAHPAHGSAQASLCYGILSNPVGTLTCADVGASGLDDAIASGYSPRVRFTVATTRTNPLTPTQHQNRTTPAAPLPRNTPQPRAAGAIASPARTASSDV